jgi:lipoprotein-releasing system permease protein
MIRHFEWHLALRYLRSKREDRFVSAIALFSFLGVALGVAALIVVMAVMNGFHQELLSRILGFNGHVVLHAGRQGIPSPEYWLNEIKKRPDVVHASLFVEGQVMITHNGLNSGALVRGMHKKDLQEKPLIMEQFQGNWDQFSPESSTIILGRAIASQLGVTIGDVVTLIAPQTTYTIMGMVPRIKNATVIGTFHSNMYQYDNSMAFIPLALAQRYFQYPNPYGMEIFLKDPANAPSWVQQTEPSLLVAGLQLTDWQQTNGHFFQALKTERAVMFLILTLIIIVAAFNIISSMIMLVKDKQSAIAILRTMGASRGSILRIFFLCGSAIGLLGTLVGFGLGLAFSLNIETIRQWLQRVTGTTLFDPVIYFLSELPAEVRSEDVIHVVLLALLLSFLATLYPAWRASTIQPVEALRYE